jgi:2-keto-4-pentenoate hydratase
MSDPDLPPAGALAAAIAASDAGGLQIPDDAVAGIELDLLAGGAVQLQVLMQHIAAGDSVGGWKVGMTSGDNRDKMGHGIRPFGFVRGSRVFPSGASIPFAGIPDPGIEPELGVRIGAALAGDVTREQVLAAIDGIVPCFELGQRRLSTSSDGVSVAADLSQWGIVVGEVTAWPASIDAVEVALDRDGTRVADAGPGFAIDDPIESLRTLCAGLARYGLGLLPGQYVITGAFAKARVGGPGRWRAAFGALGVVEVEFAGSA